MNKPTKLKDIWTEDFNPWFEGSEYGRDELEEAIEKTRDLFKELVGEDDSDTRGTTQNPDNPNYWTRKTKCRNEFRAELRQKIEEL